MKISPAIFRLTASLALNVVAKTPALVLAVSVLPTLKTALDLENYAQLLSLLAFGALFTIPFSGINAAGRRIGGQEYAGGNELDQANVFYSMCILSILVAVILSFIVLICIQSIYGSAKFYGYAGVAILPLILGMFNSFDNARASYNEHFVTAALQFLFQITIYCGVIFFPPEKITIFDAGLIIQAPFLLASLATGFLLIRKRPYLLKGRPRRTGELLQGSALVSISDGTLMGAINLSVFLIVSYASAEVGAWYGTFVRLFQMGLAPVLLIMVPLTSFLTLRWQKWTAQHKLRAFKGGVLGVVLYSSFVGLILYLGAETFIFHFYRIEPIRDVKLVGFLASLMSCVIAQKIYCSIIYSIDNGLHISLSSSLVSTLSILVSYLIYKYSGINFAFMTWCCFLSFGLLVAIGYDMVCRIMYLKLSERGGA